MKFNRILYAEYVGYFHIYMQPLILLKAVRLVVFYNLFIISQIILILILIIFYMKSTFLNSCGLT